MKNHYKRCNGANFARHRLSCGGSDKSTWDSQFVNKNM